MRARFIASFVSFAAFVIAAPASAQDRMVADDLLAQQASIDTESAAATGLYVGAVIAHVGGLVAAPVAMMMGIGVCAEEDPACAQAWSYGALSSLIVAGLGAVALGLAIGLDVDSGVRRRRLQREASNVELSLRIGPLGAALLGRF